MSKYYTIREKLPQEGEEVLICTVIGGVFRMRYEGGKFVKGDIVLGPEKILKWRYPE